MLRVCQNYVEILPRLRRDYVEIMPKLCRGYVETMLVRCRNYVETMWRLNTAREMLCTAMDLRTQTKVINAFFVLELLGDLKTKRNHNEPQYGVRAWPLCDLLKLQSRLWLSSQITPCTKKLSYSTIPERAKYHQSQDHGNLPQHKHRSLACSASLNLFWMYFM